MHAIRYVKPNLTNTHGQARGVAVAILQPLVSSLSNVILITQAPQT